MVRHGSTSWPVTAVILAAGAGRRMGSDVPKQYLPIGGAPLLAWTATAFDRSAVVDEIVLVVPKHDLQFVADAIVAAFHVRKVRRIVAGGSTRQESMEAGLAAVKGEGVVLVHDGVRPFVSEGIIAAAAECAAMSGAALVAVPITDTVKRVNDRGEVVETIPRERLWAAQTPQAFRVSLLRRAVERAKAEGYAATDEAVLVERLGVSIPVVPGEPDNVKITTPEDHRRAEEICKRKDPPC